LSARDDILDLVKKYPEKDWDWNFLTDCKDILDLIEEFPEKDWDWDSLSARDDILDLVKKYPEKDWNWDELSGNPHITLELLISNPKKSWNLKKLVKSTSNISHKDLLRHMSPEGLTSATITSLCRIKECKEKCDSSHVYIVAAHDDWEDGNPVPPHKAIYGCYKEIDDALDKIIDLKHKLGAVERDCYWKGDDVILSCDVDYVYSGYDISIFRCKME